VRILGRLPGKSRNSLSGKPFFHKDVHDFGHGIRVTPTGATFGRDESLLY